MLKKFRVHENLEIYRFHGYLEGPIFCLDENTSIWTVENDNVISKKLIDLPKKFKVLSFDLEKHKMEEKKATKFESGTKECVEIEFKNGKRVICTEEHCFFNELGKRVCVKDLKPGDTLIYNMCLYKNRNAMSQEEYRNKVKKGVINWCKSHTSRPLIENRNLYLRIKELALSGYTAAQICNKISKSELLNYLPKRIVNKTVKLRSRMCYKIARNFKDDVLLSILYKNHRLFLSKFAKKMRKKQNYDYMRGKNNPSYGIPRYPVSFFCKELNHYVRSSWEKNVCCELIKNKIRYEYESVTFEITENSTYTPDIEVNKSTYIEVKGPLHEDKIEKLKLFKKKYPKIVLIVITCKANFKKLNFCDLLLDYFKLEESMKNEKFLQYIKN